MPVDGMKLLDWAEMTLARFQQKKKSGDES
jgi:hypothetical protein